MTREHLGVAVGNRAGALAGGGPDEDPPPLEDQVQRAFAFLLRSTQARPQTRAELAEKLRARDVPDDIAATALDQAEDVGAVDDAAFARAWVTDRGEGRGYGVARLRHELTRRRVPDALAEEALSTLDQRDDLTVATALAASRAQRYPATTPPETVARRLVAFLVRRGYPPGLSQRVAMAVSGLDRRWD